MISLIARLLLAATFGFAAVAKLADRMGTRTALSDFGLPAALAGVGGLALPLCELVLALLLIPSASASGASIGCLALLALFTAAIARVRAQGRAPDCHCFGTLHSAPVGARTIARIGILAALAVLVLADGPGESVAAALRGVDPWALVGVLVLVVVVAAQAAVSWQLMRQNGRLLDRVRALEEGAAGPRRSSAPPPGLPLGVLAPAFALPDLDGVPRTLEELLARGRPLALAFSEPDCQACSALPALLARLQAARDGELEVALISRGSVEENVAKLGARRLATVLVQREREVALDYGVASVPCALTIDPDGRVSSRLAIGASAIEELLSVPSDPPAWTSVKLSA